MRHSIVNQTAPIDRKSELAVRRTIEKRIKRILVRVASRIQRISIVITDENGPRGGVDKYARVKVSLRGLGSITTTGRHEHLLGAIDIALQRARRMIVKRLNRRKTLARRPFDSSDSTLDSIDVVLVD